MKNGNKKELRAALFSIDGTEKYKGYTYGDTWNGWACPLFTFAVAEKVLRASCGGNSGAFKYDKALDQFTLIFNGEEPEEFKGERVEVNGLVVTLYAVGAFSWVWDEEPIRSAAELREITELRGFIKRHDANGYETLEGTETAAELRGIVRGIQEGYRTAPGPQLVTAPALETLPAGPPELADFPNYEAYHIALKAWTNKNPESIGGDERDTKAAEPRALFDVLKGHRIRITGGKKFPIGLEGVITCVEARGYNDMVHFIRADNGERAESASYNLGVID